MNRVPIIVVLGATGSGKSKLAIELALKYNGEVISADSMQVYKGLDVITNKVTREERNMVPHHIIDFLSPLKHYSVVEFRNHALQTINAIIKRNKTPVIVGGTNYYIEAILWKILIDTDPVEKVSVFPEGISDERSNIESRVEQNLTMKASSVDSDASVSKLPSDDSVAKEIVTDKSLPQMDNDPCSDSDASIRENLLSTLLYCEAIFNFIQDSLHAPMSKLFECINPVYSIQPNTSPEELQSFSSRIFSKMFGQTDVIENIKRHKASIQITISIVDELLLLVYELQNLVNLAQGKLRNPEPQTYSKSVLLPNLFSKNIFQFTNFISALFPRMPELRSDIDHLFKNIDDVALNTDDSVADSFSNVEFVSKIDSILKCRLTNINHFLTLLKDVVILEEDCLLHLPCLELHSRLKAVDPVRASVHHPNDRRKVFRSLQIYLQTGKTHSELLKKQKGEEGGSDLGGPLRFPNTCVFWIQTQQPTLDIRLDGRVDEMIKNGLIEELTEFHDQYNDERLSNDKLADYTKGIFQSIGFKEFHKFLILSKEERQTDEGQKQLRHCIELLKCNTRRYSRYQIKWIKNRFLRSKNRHIPPLFAVDSTDVAEWNSKVYQPACDVVKYFLAEGVEGLDKCSIKPLPKEDHPEHERHKDFYCDVCERLFIGTLQWEAHLKSKRHAKAKKHLKKREADLIDKALAKNAARSKDL